MTIKYSSSSSFAYYHGLPANHNALINHMGGEGERGIIYYSQGKRGPGSYPTHPPIHQVLLLDSS